MKPIDTLTVLEHLLQPLEAPFFFQAPSNLLERLPALLVEQSPPSHFSSNIPNPYLSAKAVISLNALAPRRTQAMELASQAFSLIHDSVHQLTGAGWVTRSTPVTLPHLVAHDYQASPLFQYSAALELIFRQTPDKE